MVNFLTTKIYASIAVQVLVLQAVACGTVNKLPGTNGATINNRSSSGDQDPNGSSAAPSGDAQVSRPSSNTTTQSTTISGNGTTQPSTTSGSPGAGIASGQTPGAGGPSALSLSPGTSQINADAIAHCLASWGANNPFGPNKTTADATLDVSVKVGNISAPINDITVTAQPRLVLIPAVGSIAGIMTYNLLNPNGWYCLMADVHIGSSAWINIKSGAHLSENGVDGLVGKAHPLGGLGGVVNANVASHETINVVP